MDFWSWKIPYKTLPSWKSTFSTPTPTLTFLVLFDSEFNSELEKNKFRFLNSNFTKRGARLCMWNTRENERTTKCRSLFETWIEKSNLIFSYSELKFWVAYGQKQNRYSVPFFKMASFYTKSLKIEITIDHMHCRTDWPLKLI